MRIRTLDLAFNTLAIVAILNVNGAVMMAVGVPQVGSVFMLAACLVLLSRLAGTRMPWPDIALISSVLLYLVLATFYAGMRGNPQATALLLIAYVISVLMLWAMSGYMARAVARDEMAGVLALIRNLLLAGSATILLSPLLYGFFLTPPPSSDSRFGGFYGNPNEAGVIACCATAFLLNVPFQSRPLQLLCLFGVLLAALLTFSKTAWLVISVISILYLLRRGMQNFFALFLLVALTVLLSLIGIPDMLRWVIANPFFELDLVQVRRLEAIVVVLSGESAAGSALTGRDQIWSVGLTMIEESPLIGHGLGSFHNLIGGLYEDGTWQGIHNVYLMFWGEAGLPAVLAFTLASLLIASRVLQRHVHPVAVSLGLILLLNLQVNHNILTSRYFIVLLGVLLGLLRTTRPVSKVFSQ